MKHLFTIVVLLLLTFNSYLLTAQPLKSPLFGKDIVVHDMPDRDQRNAAICSAFNGWLYIGYTYVNDNWPWLTIMRSEDGGISWTVISDNLIPYYDSPLILLKMAMLGDSLSNLKVVIASVTSGGTEFCLPYNGLTGEWENLIGEQIFPAYDIDIATDNGNTAPNFNPYTIGLLISRRGYTSPDSIIFISADNGGLTINERTIVATTPENFPKVSLTFGRSSAYPDGNYFAAWEEQDSDIGTTPGHIYTAHTFPNSNSSFTTPICLDSLDSGNIQLCMHPSIACQYNNVDNDSSNMTEVILFDRYDAVAQKYTVKGYYNLQAMDHDKFNGFTLSDSTSDSFQPDIDYNPFDSSFFVTYYNNSELKLPLLKKNFNFNDPDNWQVITSGYNDNTDLTSPNPKIRVNKQQQLATSVWIAENSKGNGVVMFDSQYSTWTGNQEPSFETELPFIDVFPNPCSDVVNISIKPIRSEKVAIKIFDVSGQLIDKRSEQINSYGDNIIQFNAAALSSGSYIVLVQGEGWNKKRLFTKIK